MLNCDISASRILASIVLGLALVQGTIARGTDLVADLFSEHGAPLLLLDNQSSAARQAQEACREFGFPGGASHFALRNVSAAALSEAGFVVFDASTHTFAYRTFDKSLCAFVAHCPPAALEGLRALKAITSSAAFPWETFARLLEVLPEVPVEGSFSVKSHLQSLYVANMNPEPVDEAETDPAGTWEFGLLRALLSRIGPIVDLAIPEGSAAEPNVFKVFSELQAQEGGPGAAGESKAPVGDAAPPPAAGHPGVEGVPPDPIPAAPGVSLGHYAAPNEWETFTYENVLRNVERDGALLSVGSLRTLFDANLGHFSRVYMVDYDARTTAFNHANLDLIEALHGLGPSLTAQRHQYVALLARKVLPPAFLTELEGEDEASEALTLAIDALGQPDLGSLPAPVREAALRLWGALLKAGSDRAMLRPMAHFTLAQKRITFWFEDQSWAKLQGMIRDKRFVVVSGDLLGDVTIPAIAKDLARTARYVSAIDLSNVLDFVPIRSAKERELAVNKIIKNLSQLPGSPGAAVLVTSSITGIHPSRSRAGRDQFAYFAFRKSYFEHGFLHELKARSGWAPCVKHFLPLSNYHDARRRVGLIPGPAPGHAVAGMERITPAG